MTLQSELQNTKERLDRMEKQVRDVLRDTNPSWPVVTKFAFRKLLTPEQLVLWDNWRDMDLGLTQEEKWQMNSFFKSFESAEKITMTDDMMQQGMTFFVTKALVAQDEADRVLAGYKPGEWPLAEEEEI